ncbi:MAG: polyphosphate kinase 1 [Chitinophagales bacterium]|nr:polyphosphate kinase 1 [Sphingobacteriales bacterium]
MRRNFDDIVNELKINYIEDTLPKVNRELSWLAFNERVLFEALDSNVPVLERLRFLGIYSNNLDEFFRVRVGTLHRLMLESNEAKLNYSPKKVLSQIYLKLREDEKIFATAFNDIKAEMKSQGIQILSEHELNEKQLSWCRDYFKKNIRKGIAPLILKDSQSFPTLRDQSIYLAIKLTLQTGKKVYSLIEIPTDFFSRFIELPAPKKGEHRVILLEDMIRINLDEIYKVFNCKEASAYTIKLTRDAELDLDSDFSKSDLGYLSKSLMQRKKGQPVRFIADKTIAEDLLAFLLKKIKISKSNLVLSGRYHNFKDFMQFPEFGLRQLRYPKIESLPNIKLEGQRSLLEVIEKQDVMLFYPYNSFSYLLDFLRDASIDPFVEEIKMTLYRLSSKSQIVNILTNAVKNGKKVTVIMEITARFDEANNIYWANQMTEEGIHVIFGHPQLKVHSKLVYIVKKIGRIRKEYCNISTGNFNEVTADIYSDLSLFTTNKNLTFEVGKVFNYLEFSKPHKFKHLLVSPFTMRSQILSKINRERTHAINGKKAEIIIKMNSLVDDEIIDALYEAEKVGVNVQIIVRGICCVALDIPKNKQLYVISIVDKFLEHARVLYFYNDGDEECYISSADLMVRNLDYRIEVAAPLLDPIILQKVKHFLNIQLSDNVKGRVHNDNMSNARNTLQKQKKKVRSQIEIYNWLEQDYLTKKAGK